MGLIVKTQSGKTLTEIENDLAEKISDAILSGRTLPEFPEGLSLAEAYELQHQVTALRPEGALGIKAGVTARNAQAFFGLDHALLASLYGGRRLASGAQISYVEGRLVETEVAIKMDENGCPISIAPALEIVAVRFSDSKQMNAANLVGCNLGADLIVVGEFQPWQPAFDQLAISLRRSEAVINDSVVSDALGGPEKGAPWLLSEASQRGFKLDDDVIFMMGACGKAIPAERGVYQGNYGALGNIELVVK